MPWADAGDPAQVYFSPRDREGRAHIARIGVDLDAVRLLDGPPELVLGPGRLGAFDDRGVTMSCLVRHGGREYLYYTGWTLGVTVPFYFYVGLAVSSDGGRTFERASEAPILERSALDPYLTASPCVLVEDGIWRMWYVSALGWEILEGEPRHQYLIRYAESDDGIAWTRTGQNCLDFASDDEYAFGRPCVVRDDDCYRMWYCVRGPTYRIGYAESPDGLSWTRLDGLAGISASSDGWDSEMLAYPWVVSRGGRRRLLYNGNGYGRTGFGLAEQLVKDGVDRRTSV